MLLGVYAALGKDGRTLMGERACDWLAAIGARKMHLHRPKLGLTQRNSEIATETDTVELLAPMTRFQSSRRRFLIRARTPGSERVADGAGAVHHGWGWLWRWADRLSRPGWLAVAGQLIRDPAPGRLTNIGQHSRSPGFPVAHPQGRPATRFGSRFGRRQGLDHQLQRPQRCF